MANIILKNRSNQEQTYEGVEVVQLNTDTGETAAFVSRELIPEPYVHPKTHPASMIEGLKKAATSGDYRDLRNKPCYPMPSLAKTVLTFAYDEEMQDHHATIEGSFQLDKGDAYTVSWDGTDYFCTVKDPADSGLELGFRYLGNLQRFWNSNLGEDTGEPFILMVSDDECTTLAAETNAAGPHTVGITPAKAVHPLDAEYLPESAATKSWVQSQISTGGGGGGIPNRIIFPEQEVTFDGGGAYDLTFNPSLVAWFLSEWDSATVTFDGTVYTLTPWQVAEDGLTIKGVGYAKSEGVGDDSNCPFYIIGAEDMGGTPGMFAAVNDELVSDGIGSTKHAISIAVPVTAEKTFTIPTFDFSGTPIGVGTAGVEETSDIMKFVVPWLMCGAVNIKFTYQLDDSTTCPATVRVSDFLKMEYNEATFYSACVPFTDLEERDVEVLILCDIAHIIFTVTERTGNTTTAAGTT